MKTYLLSLTGLALALMLMGFASPAHAAQTSGTEVLPPADAAVLKQTLDVLQITLDEIEWRVEAGAIPRENYPRINTVLTGLEGGLVALNGTLNTRVAMASPAPKAPVALAPSLPKPEQGVVTVAPSDSVAKVEVGNMPPSTPASENGQLAAVSESSGFNSRGLLWFGVVLLGILGAVFFMRAYDTKSDSSAEIAQAEMSQ